jgi:hypothetical protein
MFFFVMSPNVFSLFLIFVTDACVLWIVDERNLRPLYFGRVIDAALTVRLFASLLIWMLAYFVTTAKKGSEVYHGGFDIPYRTPLWNGVFVSHLMLEMFVPLLLLLTYQERDLSLKNKAE